MVQNTCGIDGDARLNVRGAASSAPPDSGPGSSGAGRHKPVIIDVQKQLSVDCITPQSLEVDVRVRG